MNLVKALVIILALGVLSYSAYFYLYPSKNKLGDLQPQTVSPSTTGSTTPNKVALSSDGFVPQTLTITVGQTVTWENNSGGEASVSSDPHPIHTNYSPLNLGRFIDGGALSLKFNKPGTYGYHNHLNPAQTGKIVVE